jgi:hypothetical protein
MSFGPGAATITTRRRARALRAGIAPPFPARFEIGAGAMKPTNAVHGAPIDLVGGHEGRVGRWTFPRRALLPKLSETENERQQNSLHERYQSAAVR